MYDMRVHGLYAIILNAILFERKNGCWEHMWESESKVSCLDNCIFCGERKTDGDFLVFTYIVTNPGEIFVRRKKK